MNAINPHLAASSAPHELRADAVHAVYDDMSSHLEAADDEASESWREYGFTTAPSAAAVTEARGWLLDCGFDEDSLDELADWHVADVLIRNYEGGWAAFALAIGELPEQPSTPSTTKGSIR